MWLLENLRLHLWHVVRVPKQPQGKAMHRSFTEDPS